MKHIEIFIFVIVVFSEKDAFVILMIFYDEIMQKKLIFQFNIGY